ncbi:hypothetical protein DESC_770156 [Desulfosarcina cetonica]|nr:hypothetical protein DESC_770156 [Desulfosarcina cetonica]
MDIRDQGNRNGLFDLQNGFGGGQVGNGHAHDFAAGLGQPMNLGDGTGNIIGFRVGHGLDADGRPVSHRNGAYPDPPGFLS